MTQYGIFDTDKGSWIEETLGLDYYDCLRSGYDLIGKGKLPAVNEYDMLKFMVANHFDLRPLGR